MRLIVTVKPRSSKNEVSKISESEYQIRLRASPVDGEANEQLIRVLSEHFRIPRSRIVIIQGHTNKKKIIELQ